MFGWLWRRDDAFRPSDQKIYRYFNGKRVVRGDPLELMRNLTADENGALELDLKTAELPTGDSPKAMARVVVVVRKVFGVKPIDEGGLTEQACLELLRHFIDYIGALKKNTASRPTVSKPSASDNPEPTRLSRESSSIETASSTVEAPV